MVQIGQFFSEPQCMADVGKGSSVEAAILISLEDAYLGLAGSHIYMRSWGLRYFVTSVCSFLLHIVYFIVFFLQLHVNPFKLLSKT